MIIVDMHCNIGGNILDMYTCILNLTDIKVNKNRFYIMQIIDTPKPSFDIFIRYGRIGEVGKIITETYKKKSDAISRFTRQFRKKTGNTFGDIFNKKKNKYYLSEMSDPELENNEEDSSDSGIENEDNQLNNQLKFLLDLISNKNMLNNALIKLNIDPKKMPLGKISQNQIDKANEIIIKINDIICPYQDHNISVVPKDILEEIRDLSSEYYTLVPYCGGGRRKLPLLEKAEKIDSNFSLLEELKNIHITYTITQNKLHNNGYLTNIYNQLNINIAPVDPKSQIYVELLKYAENTHCQTHTCKLEITHIYEIKKIGDDIYDNRIKKNSNKMLLFHGSNMSNWCSILKNGLLLDPSKLGVKITGKMFGYGIYWTNAITKAYNYCGNDTGDKSIVLGIGEVELGKPLEQFSANYYLSQEYLDNLGRHSTWGKGQSSPGSITTIDGIQIPNGKLKKSGSIDPEKNPLLYDEFVIYNTNQYRFKYLMVVKNTN